MKLFNKKIEQNMTREEIIEEINNCYSDISLYENKLKQAKEDFEQIKNISDVNLNELKNKKNNLKDDLIKCNKQLSLKFKEYQKNLNRCNEQLYNLIQEQTEDYSQEIEDKKNITEELVKTKTKENLIISSNLKKQIDDLISKQNEEIQFLSDAYDLNINNLKQTLEDQRTHYENIFNNLEMKYNEIYKTGEHDVIEETKNQMSISQNIQQVQSKYKLIEANKDHTIKQLIDEYRNKYEELLKQNAEEIKQMQDLMNKSIEELKLELMKVKEKKDAAHINYENELTSLNREKEKFKLKHTQKVNEYNSEIDVLETEERELKTKLESIKQDIAYKEQKISDLKLEHKNKLVELNNEHQLNIKTLKDNYKQQNNDLEQSLKTQLKEKKTELNNLKTSLIDKKEKQILDYKAQLKLLEDEYNLKTKNLEDKIEAYEEQNQEKVNVLKEYTLKLNKDLADLELLHSNKMHEYDMALENEKLKWDSIIKEAEHRYEEEAKAIKTKFNTNVSSLNREIKELEVEIVKIENQTEGLNKQHHFDLELYSKQLLKAKQNYEERCENINQNLSVLANKITDYEISNNEIIKNLKEISNQNKLDIDKLEMDFKVKQEDLAKENEILLEKLNLEHGNNLSNLNKEVQSLETAFQDELRNLELKFISDKQNVEIEFEQKIKEFEIKKLDLDDRFKKYNEKTQTESSTIEAQISKLKADLENVENNHSEQVRQLQEENDKKLTSLKQEYELETATLKAAEDEQIAKLEADYNSLVETKIQKNQDLEKLNLEFEKTLAELKKEYAFDDSMLVELESKLANRQSELDMFKSEQELLVLNRLNTKDQLHNQFNKKTEELTEKLNNAKKEAEEILNAKQLEYQAEEKQLNDSNQAYKNELDSKIVKTKDKYESELNALREANELKLIKANAEFEEYCQDFDDRLTDLNKLKESMLNTLKENEDSNDEKIKDLKLKLEEAKKAASKEYEANKAKYDDSVIKIKEEIHNRINETQSANNQLKEDIKAAEIEYQTIKSENDSKLETFKNQFENRQKELDHMLEEYELRFRDLEREKAYLTAEYELKVGMVDKDISALNKKMADIEFENSEAINSVIKDLKLNLDKKASAFEKIKNVLAKNKEEIKNRYQKEEESLSQIYKNRFEQVGFALEEALFEIENLKASVSDKFNKDVSDIDEEIIKEALAYDLDKNEQNYQTKLAYEKDQLLVKQTHALNLLKDEEKSLLDKNNQIKEGIVILNNDYQQAFNLTINSMKKMIDEYKLKLDRYTYNDKEMSDITVEIKEEKPSLAFQESKTTSDKKGFGLFKRKN